MESFNFVKYTGGESISFSIELLIMTLCFDFLAYV